MVEAVLKVGKLIEVRTRLNVVQEDPSDNKILECAIDGEADYIVSGDEYLLKIGEYKGIRIISPREFIGLLTETSL